MEPGVQSKFRMTERRNVIYRKYLQSVFCIALVLTVLTGCGKYGADKPEHRKKGD